MVADRAERPRELILTLSCPDRRGIVAGEQAIAEGPREGGDVHGAVEEAESTNREIAKLVECPLGTVASRLRRGRDIFEAAVAELTQGEER